MFCIRGLQQHKTGRLLRDSGQTVIGYCAHYSDLLRLLFFDCLVTVAAGWGCVLYISAGGAGNLSVSQFCALFGWYSNIFSGFSGRPFKNFSYCTMKRCHCRLGKDGPCARRRYFLRPTQQKRGQINISHTGSFCVWRSLRECPSRTAFILHHRCSEWPRRICSCNCTSSSLNVASALWRISLPIKTVCRTSTIVGIVFAKNLASLLDLSHHFHVKSQVLQGWPCLRTSVRSHMAHWFLKPLMKIVFKT